MQNNDYHQVVPIKEGIMYHKVANSEASTVRTKTEKFLFLRQKDVFPKT